jgi:hypothetical protein
LVEVEMLTATVVIPPEMIGMPPEGIVLVQLTPGLLTAVPATPLTSGTTVPQATEEKVSACGAEKVLKATFSCPLAPWARLNGLATPMILSVSGAAAVDSAGVELSAADKVTL